MDLHPVVLENKLVLNVTKKDTLPENVFSAKVSHHFSLGIGHYTSDKALKLQQIWDVGHSKTYLDTSDRPHCKIKLKTQERELYKGKNKIHSMFPVLYNKTLDAVIDTAAQKTVMSYELLKV